MSQNDTLLIYSHLRCYGPEFYYNIEIRFRIKVAYYNLFAVFSFLLPSDQAIGRRCTKILSELTAESIFAPHTT